MAFFTGLLVSELKLPQGEDQAWVGGLTVSGAGDLGRNRSSMAAIKALRDEVGFLSSIEWPPVAVWMDQAMTTGHPRFSR